MEQASSRVRRVVKVAVALAVAALVWEGLKWIAGDPWRLTSIGYFHDPPVHILQFSDLQLPHLWDIVGAFAQPFQRNGATTLGEFLVDQAAYTWAVALIGFFVGALHGHPARFASSSTLGCWNAAFVPYVVASQTIPIVALAPLIVGQLRARPDGRSCSSPPI